MADEAYILRLPPELCVRIADYLMTAELGPLRRSCKQIEANLFDSFASEFFTKRQFMIEHHSLEALVGISRHPGLAAKLSEVIISNHELGRSPPLDGYLARDVLLGTGQACEMLTEAFSNLSKLKTVGLRDYDGAGRLRDGHTARWRSWGWSFVESPLSFAPATALLPVVLLALGKGVARPESIQVIMRHHKINPYGLNLPTTDTAVTIQPVLHELKSLFLVISSEGQFLDSAPGAQYDDSNASERPLRRFLHHTSKLEHLRLNFDINDFLGYRFLNWLGRRAPATAPPFFLASPIVSSVPLPNLNTLDIGMTTVSGPDLIQLLTKFDLTSFSLWKVSLQCPGSVNQFDPWADFLLKLSKSLPTSNRIRSILIGEASQTYWHSDTYHKREYDYTVFVPEATDADKKFNATSAKKIEFKAQYTAQSATAWLQEISTRTYVPGFHVDPSRQQGRRSYDDEAEDDTEDYEEDEYNDEDDEDMDDD